MTWPQRFTKPLWRKRPSTECIRGIVESTPDRAIEDVQWALHARGRDGGRDLHVLILADGREPFYGQRSLVGYSP